MIYVTGDLHGRVDIKKLSSSNFPEGINLTRSDYVIICGDFGLIWERNSRKDKYWLSWLDEKPWTTLWIDGNHENFDLLNEYLVDDWQGGKVHKITDNIIHLCRGSLFELNGKRVFAFGGAESHDKQYRRPGRSWWEDEMPTVEEMEYGRKILDSADWNVDIVLTHSLPSRIQNDLFKDHDYPTNALTDYFDKIDSRLDFKTWFSGHYHKSIKYDEKHILVYNDIVRIT